MSLLVFSLSIMPCMDAFALNEDSAKTEISSSDNCPDHNDADKCTPFCTCSCCAGFTISNAFFKTEAIYHGQAKAYNTYLPPVPTEVSLPVWQPPKLS